MSAYKPYNTNSQGFQLFTNKRKSLPWAWLAVILVIALGFGVGFYAGGNLEHKTASTSEYAVHVLQNQPDLTWRLKYFPANAFAGTGRDGLWVSRFKPRYTGTDVYVIFRQKRTRQSYVLLTLQNRVIDNEKVIVCEPPAGFFNGEYPSSIPHIVAESAEREIETQVALGNKNINQEAIYQNYMQKYINGEFSEEERAPYETDKNLIETAYREVKEEAGLDIPVLEKQVGITMTHKIIDELETPSVYAIIRRIDIQGDKLPDLIPKNNNEIVHNEWVRIQDIDIVNMTVHTSKGIYPIKPRDKIPENLAKLVKELNYRAEPYRSALFNLSKDN